MQGDTASAVNRYHQVLGQDSTVVEIWINLCQIYARSGQRHEALEALAKAKRYGQDNPRVDALEAWTYEVLADAD